MCIDGGQWESFRFSFPPSHWWKPGSIYCFAFSPPPRPLSSNDDRKQNTIAPYSKDQRGVGTVGIVRLVWSIMVERGQRFPDLIEPVLPRRGLVYQESNPQLVLCKVGCQTETYWCFNLKYKNKSTLYWARSVQVQSGRGARAQFCANKAKPFCRAIRSSPSAKKV